MDKHEMVYKLLPALEPEGRYATGCPQNKTCKGLYECLCTLAGDSQELKKAIDERLDSRRRELREQAEAGLVEGKSYSGDFLWCVELKCLSRDYERGECDDSEEGAALRSLLAEACEYSNKNGGRLVFPEELVRRYVELTFESWKKL